MKEEEIEAAIEAIEEAEGDFKVGFLFTVYSLQFTVYSLRFTVYGLQFAVYSLRFKIFL